MDFKSIRFIRMFLTKFEKPVFLRFARLDLVRGEWRKYTESFLEGGAYQPTEMYQTSFDVSAVNIEENGSKQPVNYVIPPGITRVIDPTNPQLRQLNEQALMLKACELEDGDSRACYRNVNMDVRQYKRLEMFVHAEALPGRSLNDDEIAVFVRLGSDYQNNYYEYEITLKVTQPGNYNNDDELSRLAVWPDENRLDFSFDVLQGVKQRRNNEMRRSGSTITMSSLYSEYIEGDRHKISVMGNPNLSNVKTIMIGIRNRSQKNNPLADDGMPKCAEVWVNELRLTDFDQRGGWAANLRMTARLADFGSVSLAGFTSTPGFGSLEKKVSERSKENVNQYDFSSNFELGRFLPENIKLNIPMFIGYSESFRNPQYNPLDPDIPLRVSLDDMETKSERDSLKYIVQDYSRRKSMNFTNVRLNKMGGAPKIYDVSNFSASYSFNEVYSRNINTEYNRLKHYRGALTYNFNNTPKNVAPFEKNNKLLKSPMLRLIKDFNFYYAPTQISFMTDVNRSYNEIQARSIDNPNLIIPPTYNKDFSWNRMYDLKWDITKSLKFDFMANNVARIDEPTVNQRVNRAYGDEYQQWKDTVWQSVTDLGRTVNYRHNYNLNYTVPINKIPLFNWVSMNARYSGGYEWTTGPRTADTIRLGNTIKNNNTMQLNTTANMTNLYNKVPYLKTVNQKYGRQKRPQQKKPKIKVYYPKQDEPPRYINVREDVPRLINHKLKTEDVSVKLLDSAGVEIPIEVRIINDNRVSIIAKQDYRGAQVKIEGEREDVENPLKIVFDQSLRVIMSVKTVSVTFSETNGTFVPGYMPRTQMLGMEDYNNTNVFAPGFKFISGYQDKDFIETANKRGWLTDDTLLNSAYLLNTTQSLNLRINAEPVNGMRVDITANRTFGTNITEYYRYDTPSGMFIRHNQMITGNFSMTYGTWRTAFERFSESDYSSKVFEQFKNYRITVAQRQAKQRANSQGADDNLYTGDALESGFPDGYGATSQEVLIPAFLAAYSGKNPDRVSLDYFPSALNMMPNWTVTYDGLTRIKQVRKYFRTLIVSHSYRSSYSVNSYNTNLAFNDPYADGFGWVRYTLGNFIPEHEINQVSISEQFSPLINFDGTLNNSLILKFELKKSRNLSFGLTNNQLNEIKSSELIIGTGYRYKDFAFVVKSGGTSREYKSDLNMRADLSIRDDFTIIRKVEELSTGGFDQLTSGNKMITLKISADYVLSNRFNLRLFYDRIVRKPKVSNAFPTFNTNIGVSVRFTLAQ